MTYAREGIVPGGTHANRRFLSESVEFASGVDEASRLLVCDAQTSGGLLIAVSPERSQALVSALAARGTPCAEVIGQLDDGPVGTARVMLR
jgi:selenide,water dikinase